MSDKVLDSPDIYELILKYVVRSKEAYDFAVDCGFSIDDLMSSDIGISVYREFASIVFHDVKEAPVDKDTLSMFISVKLANGGFASVMADDVRKLLHFLYEPFEPNLPFFRGILPMFIKRRRMTKIKMEYDDDIDQLQIELSKLAIDLDRSLAKEESTLTSPFAQAIIKPKHSGIPLGITKLDSVIGGLQFGTYTLMVGFSGCGKTALTTKLTTNVAFSGYTGIYASAEEGLSDISQRVYAQNFNIPYDDLYRGRCSMEVDQALHEMDQEQRKLLIEKFQVMDLKKIAPITVRKFQQELDKYADKGAVADFVCFDQMDYLEPTGGSKGDKKWEKQDALSFECDILSHHLIGGTKGFALCVNHQAMGKPKIKFDRDQIEGFKNMIKPADWAFGLGRDGIHSNDFCLFSLKVRHSSQFEIPMTGNLKYMLFEVKDDNTVKRDYDLYINPSQSVLNIPPPPSFNLGK